MLLPACKLLVVGRFAKGEGFFWLDDLDGIRLARRESLAVLLKKRRACPAMKRVVYVCKVVFVSKIPTFYRDTSVSTGETT